MCRHPKHPCSTFSWFIVLILIASLRAQEPDLTLPVFHLTVDSTHLEKLYANPLSNEYYPAQLVFGSLVYNCEVRFRGSSSRTLPKKSWRIRFSDRDNIFSVKKLNLNAEYRDKTLMRNFLAMQLFRSLDLPAPETEFASLVLNDQFMGVFVKVENVDEDFLEKRGKNSNGELYKAISHGANTAPLLRFSQYPASWEKKIGQAGNYDELQRLLNQFRYWHQNEFQDSAQTVIEVEQILRFFAIQLAISSADGFTKNQFLYANPATARYELFPWDNDAAFGNDFQGSYQGSLVRMEAGDLKDHLLFQRLMDFSNWREKFYQNLDSVLGKGFAFADSLIDATVNAIRHDVYLDSAKLGSNEDFEIEITQLKSFLTKRADFLSGLTPFQRIPLTELSCSNPFPPAAPPKAHAQSAGEIVFRAKSAAPQDVFVEYARGLDFNVPGDQFIKLKIPLFDDGLHDDGQAGDLVYGNRWTLPAEHTGVLPFTFRGGKHSYPANGHFYIEYTPAHMFALNVSPNRLADYQKLEFGEVFHIDDEYIVEIRNKGGSVLDLSLCYLQSGSKINRFSLPPGTFIESEESIYLTTRTDLAMFLFEDAQVFGELFFDIALGDTLTLLSPVYSPIFSKTRDSYGDITPISKRIVITEINYHSSPEFDPEDWVEFYNPGDSLVDISGWKFQDENDAHRFIFPQNTLLESDAYLVVCKEKSKFRTLFPDVENFIGDMGFGLSGAGELLRLTDLFGVMVDSVRYDDEAPWPTSPDGTGSTLELIDSDEDNALAANWSPSIPPGGTPGSPNSVDTTAVDDSETILPEQHFLAQNYPNPFNSETKIAYEIAKQAHVELKVFDIRGRLVEVLVDEKKSPGRYEIAWQADAVASSLFFIELKIDGSRRFVKKAIYAR